MSKNKKILGIICRRIDEKLFYLALRNNPENPSHGGDFWYVVTGGIEEKEGNEEALKRELFEETGIDCTVKILNLHTVYDFSDRKGIEWKEFCYLVLVDLDVQSLNEENVEYKWLEKEEFLELIAWEGDDLEKFAEAAEKIF